jgi:uncharacterized membrane protein YgdD (TMEM256/DUF423 family)
MNRWVVGSLALLGLGLLAIPLAFDRIGDDPEYVTVRVADSFRTSILHQSYPDPDLMNGLVLAAGCGLAAMAALLVGGDAGLKRFFVVTAVGLGALAVEETFELSELVAYKLSIDAKRTDLFLPVVAVAYLAVYRRVLLTSRRAVWVGLVGAAIFASSILVDALPGSTRIEDPLESVASLLLLTAFGTLVVDLVSRAGLVRPAEAAA